MSAKNSFLYICLNRRRNSMKLALASLSLRPRYLSPSSLMISIREGRLSSNSYSSSAIYIKILSFLTFCTINLGLIRILNNFFCWCLIVARVKIIKYRGCSLLFFSFFISCSRCRILFIDVCLHIFHQIHDIKV